MGDYTPIPTPPADPVATASAQPDSPASDPNRPISTIPADSPEATSSAQSKPADSVDQVFEATASAEIIPPADSTVTASASADLQPAVPISPQSPISPQLSDVPTEPQSSPAHLPTEAPEQDQSPPNQPPQVQPEAPRDIPVIQVENTPSQSAGIKPEPPKGTQNAPSVDIKLPETPKSSFGDLMGTPADLSEEPSIHIDPIEAPTTPPVSNEKEVSAIHRQRAVEARKQKREENLAKILELAQKKGKVDNLDIRDFLHISQTTATDYLHTLVNSGKLRKEGKAKATVYSL